MNTSKVSTARRKKNRGRGQIMMTWLIGFVSCGLFGVMITTVFSAYEIQSKDPASTIIVSMAVGAAETPLNQTADVAIRTMNRTARITSNRTLIGNADVERLTRTEGAFVENYSDTEDYPQLMKDMLKAAQEDEENASLYLALAEVYECQQNLKVKDSGTGEITHIFSKFNTDLSEMDALLYETYPFYPYTEYDVIRLASMLHMEAGADIVSDDHQRDVASVPLNRVIIGGFGGTTIGEVIDAKNQYPATKDNRTYNQREWDNALYVLQHGPTTAGTYQANFVVSTATEVLKTYDYPGFRTTYICR